MVSAGWIPGRVDRRMSALLCVLGLFGFSLSLQAAWTVSETPSGQWIIRQDGHPVLQYNFHTVPVPSGVHGRYAVARSDYIHPLYGLHGEVLTMDYPKDHPHHRGIYWAWPEVMFQGKTNDLHALQGVFARPIRILKAKGGTDGAEIVALNVWKWENRIPIVRETVWIRVRAQGSSMRILDLQFQYKALQPGISLARRHTDLYGGLNLRLSSRREQRIVRHIGPVRFPAPECWAELIGIPPGGDQPVGLVILQHPANPEYPEDWIAYPDLNWLQPAFPAAGTRFDLIPHEPLILRYRLIVREGPALKIPYSRLFTEYIQDWQPLSELRKYQFGKPTVLLRKWEHLIDQCPPQDYPAAQTALLRLLRETSSPDLQRWICQRLQVVADAKAVPALIPMLRDPKVCGAACEVLEVLPGEEVNQILRKALPNLPPSCQPPVIRLLGIRRDTNAVSILSSLIQRQPHSVVSAAAIQALGRIGTRKAATILETLLQSQKLTPEQVHAALACAERLSQGTTSDVHHARRLCHRLLAHSNLSIRDQAACWRLLASYEPEAAVRQLDQWLRSADRPSLQAAGILLPRIPEEVLIPFAVQHFSHYGPAARQILLENLIPRKSDPRLHRLLRLALQDPTCAEIAARGLARLGDAKDVPLLAELAAQSGPAAATAAQALVQIQDPEADQRLWQLVESGSPSIRPIAAQAWVTRQGKHAFPQVLSFLTSTNESLIRIAIDAVGDWGGVSEAQALADRLGSIPEKLRSGFWAALIRVASRTGRTNELVHLLVQATKNHPSQRAFVLSGLYALPCQAAEQALIEALQSQDPLLLTHVAKALLRWSGPLSADLWQVLRRAVAATSPDTDFGRLLRKALQRAYLQNARNLCLGKPVTSSHSWQGNLGPERAVDGKINLSSYWSCAHTPSSLTVDLGQPYFVSAVRVYTYWDGRRYYQYRVEGSVDQQHWELLGDKSHNTKPATKEGDLFLFSQPKRIRFLRVTMLKNSANPGVHIVEIQAFGVPPQE